jgi:tRNA modification GTPase
MDTIFAPATAAGRAGVAIIRVSGPAAFSAARGFGAQLKRARMLERVALRDSEGRVLDDALVVGFPGPRSYTGEDCVELHVHGGRATLQAVMGALASVAGLRLAQPGEFTRRAFENGKLALEAVEGLIDLIEADTEAQRLQAVRQMQGQLSRQVGLWRDQLVQALAILEAAMDFADEDLPPGLLADVEARVTGLRGSLFDELRGLSAARSVREGFEVAIVGPPNAGKSTLINAISRRDVALTSDVPGTTRDVIEVRVDLKGLPVVFLDTAGLRDTADPVEALGVSRGVARAEGADLRIRLVGDPSEATVSDSGTIVRVAMADRFTAPVEQSVSGLTGAGVDELLDEVHARLTDRLTEAGLVVQERHRAAVAEALDCLDRALEGMRSHGAWDVICEDIRLGARALESLTGKVGVEEVLGAIFSRFCIGK